MYICALKMDFLLKKKQPAASCIYVCIYMGILYKQAFTETHIQFPEQ